MKDLRAIGHFGGWLVALVALGAGACGGGSPAAKPDTGVQDVAADQQEPADVPPGTDVAPDGGVEDAAVSDDAADGAVDAGSGHRLRAGADGWAEARGNSPAAGGRSDGGDVGHAARAVGRRRRRAIHDPEGAGEWLPDQRRDAPRRWRRAGDVFGETTAGIRKPTASAIPPRSRRCSPSRRGSGTHTSLYDRLHRAPTTWGSAAASTSGSCPANTVARCCRCRARRRLPASPSTARSRTPRRR